jgi:hypothetical protein
MNVNAAAPITPSPKSRRATGTEPHSQPGNAAPPMPANRMAVPISGQLVGQPHRGDERRNQTTKEHAECQERKRLNKDRREHRSGGLQQRCVGQQGTQRFRASGEDNEADDQNDG